MANRAYLYATDVLPTADTDPKDARIVGISEYTMEVPIAPMLLMSQNPRKYSSLLWHPQVTAVVADYDGGVSRLLDELERLSDTRIADACAEARRFLEDPRQRRKFFLLECGELYWFTNEPEEQQHDRCSQEPPHFISGAG